MCEICEISYRKENDTPESEMCGFLDATMDVVADFASMLANGIYHFCRFRHCTSDISNSLKILLRQLQVASNVSVWK